MTETKAKIIIKTIPGHPDAVDIEIVEGDADTLLKMINLTIYQIIKRNVSHVVKLTTYHKKKDVSLIDDLETSEEQPF